MKRFDFLLVLALLVASFYAGFKAWTLHSQRGVTANAVIGQVSSSDGDVFQKGDADFFYVPVGNGSQVLENDQLTTGIQSEAKVQLKSLQSQIYLKEMSHIIFRLKQNSFSLDIRSGDVDAILVPGEIVLVDGKKIIAAEGGSARITYRKRAEGSSFQVLQGSVSLADGGEKSVIKADEALGNRLTMIYPAHGESVVAPDLLVKFQWQDVASLNPYVLNVFSRDRLVQSQIVNEPLAVLRLPKPGLYTWKVFPQKFPQASADGWTFQLYKEPLFELLQPLNNEEIRLSFGEERKNIAFAWKQRTADKNFLIIESADLKSVATWIPFEKVDVLSATDVTADKQLPVGTYRWKVQAGLVSSEWRTLKVQGADVPLLAPPKISDIDILFSEQIKKDGLPLSWAPVENAEGYEVEWAQSLRPMVKMNAERIPVLGAGKFKYRARTYNKMKFPGEWSEYKSVHLRKPVVLAKTQPAAPAAPPAPKPEIAATPSLSPAPVEKPKDSAPKSEGEGKLSWNGIEIPKVVSPDSSMSIVSREEKVSVDVLVKSLSCKDYEIEVDIDKKFLNPTIVKSENGKSRINLKKGSYNIRARCWKDGDMGEWSLIRQFVVQ
ncbi:MAG: hypothetical protein HUU57_14795 [Bdellovibrio sp.]|nr:hypothetical protein [Bdellovibrio sp.]